MNEDTHDMLQKEPAARLPCYRGEESRGLAFYDGIVGKLSIFPARDGPPAGWPGNPAHNANYYPRACYIEIQSLNMSTHYGWH